MTHNSVQFNNGERLDFQENVEHRPRLLVTGGSSTLGRVIVRQAAAGWQVGATYLNNPYCLAPGGNPAGGLSLFHLDLRNDSAVTGLIKAFQPAVIIHTAGSNQSDDFRNVITAGARNIIHAITGTRTRLIHISSDVVFNGKDAPYTESTFPTPIHAYGQAKAESEKIVSSANNCVIVRTSLIYSRTGDDHQSAWLKQAAASGSPVTLFTDEYRCPIWVESLAKACLELASLGYSGILNVAGEQRLNRWEFGKRLFNSWVQTVPANINPGIMPDRLELIRPKDCTLDISLARKVLTTPLPGVDDVLAPKQE